MVNILIAYYVHLNFGPKTGVFKKIVGQIASWMEKGHEVRLFVVTRNNTVREALQTLNLGFEKQVFMYQRTKKLGILFDTRVSAFNKLERAIYSANPDIIYTRQDLYYAAVKRIARNIPLIVEVNTNDYAELWIHSKIQWLYHLLTRRLLLREVAGLVFVSREISTLKHNQLFKSKYIVIGNATTIMGKNHIESVKSDKIRLVFVGQSGCTWHGVDKILYLAKAFPDWRIDIIGIDNNEFNGEVLQNVTVHGALTEVEYDQIFKQSDCAIGTLALHRKNMNEASPLKVREYLSYGLPVIIAYRDTDFPNGADFLLELPNNEENIQNNLIKIQEFVLAWKNRRVEKDHVNHLDATFKEEIRLQFFQNIVDHQQSKECRNG